MVLTLINRGGGCCVVVVIVFRGEVGGGWFLIDSTPHIETVILGVAKLRWLVF